MNTKELGVYMEGFFNQVYQIVARIPEGKVATYSQIASLLGNPGGGRIVGWAMRGAPEGLPCHRVVNKSGTLAPGHVFGGPERQKAILLAEGVHFKEDGAIDLDKDLWQIIIE